MRMTPIWHLAVFVALPAAVAAVIVHGRRMWRCRRVRNRRTGTFYPAEFWRKMGVM